METFVQFRCVLCGKNKINSLKKDKSVISSELILESMCNVSLNFVSYG